MEANKQIAGIPTNLNSIQGKLQTLLKYVGCSNYPYSKYIANSFHFRGISTVSPMCKIGGPVTQCVK